MFIAEEKLHFSLSVIFIALGEKCLSAESFLAIWGPRASSLETGC